MAVVGKDDQQSEPRSSVPVHENIDVSIDTKAATATSISESDSACTPCLDEQLRGRVNTRSESTPIGQTNEQQAVSSFPPLQLAEEQELEVDVRYLSLMLDVVVGYINCGRPAL